MRDKKLWANSSWILASIGALVLVSCSKDTAPPVNSAPNEKPQTQLTNDAASDRNQAEVWTCPMHPQIRKKGPGSCPICGMALVKRGDLQEDPSSGTQSMDAPEGHASFKLSGIRQQMIGVRYGIVERRPLFKSIEAAGRVAFDPELYTAQSEYIEALKQRERVKDSPITDVRHSAERMIESARLRLKVLGLSDQQIANLTSSGSVGPSLLIPKPGETLWIYAEVYEMDLPNVKPGLEAIISSGSLSGKEIQGRVVSVDRVINPTTRTAKVRILIPNARSMLRPEAYVEVVIRSPLGEQVVVPFDAVLDTGKQAWVFVAKESGVFEPRLITIRFRADDELAIESGVVAGEKIVTSANFLIDSESRLKGVLATQGGEAPPQVKEPSCPTGQHWDTPMKMCMPDVGK